MLQLPVVILKKSSISDMRHRKTYNYFNFQQNWVSRSVKAVHINEFAKIISCISRKKNKLHRFANTNSVFKEINYFRQASSYNVHVYLFLSKSG